MRRIRAACRRGRAAGFTLVELMLVAALTMVLMFGALYSTAESFAVVREGDARVHTHVHGRRALDRFLKDCRYAASVSVAGDAGTGWTVTIDATSSLDPDLLVYAWNPGSQVLTVSDGSSAPDEVVAGLQSFAIATETVDPGTGPVISRIKVDWMLAVSAGGEGGAVSLPQVLSLSGATWIRVNA